MEGNGTTNRLLVGKPEEETPLGRQRHKWVDNIKMNRVGWIGLVWLRIGSIGECM
jgi:hypothetical protein